MLNKKMKTALVTGASRGIGLAIANRLAKDGIEVLAPTREEMDLLSNTSIDSYVGKCKARVDILINNAGINILGGATELSDEVILQTMQINLLAPLRLIRGIAPEMGFAFSYQPRQDHDIFRKGIAVKFP